MRGTAYPKAAPTGGSGKVEKVDATSAFSGTEFVSQDLAVSERPELTAAVRHLHSNLILSRILFSTRTLIALGSRGERRTRGEVCGGLPDHVHPCR